MFTISLYIGSQTLVATRDAPLGYIQEFKVEGGEFLFDSFRISVSEARFREFTARIGQKIELVELAKPAPLLPPAAEGSGVDVGKIEIGDFVRFNPKYGSGKNRPWNDDWWSAQKLPDACGFIDEVCGDNVRLARERNGCGVCRIPSSAITAHSKHAPN